MKDFPFTLWGQNKGMLVVTVCRFQVFGVLVFPYSLACPIRDVKTNGERIFSILVRWSRSNRDFREIAVLFSISRNDTRGSESPQNLSIQQE